MFLTNILLTYLPTYLFAGYWSPLTEYMIHGTCTIYIHPSIRIEYSFIKPANETVPVNIPAETITSYILFHYIIHICSINQTDWLVLSICTVGVYYLPTYLLGVPFAYVCIYSIICIFVYL